MYLLGFSLNNLSLMAIILRSASSSTMPSWCWRTSRATWKWARTACRRRWKGPRKSAFTVLSMTLSLSAVFIPILFMEGMLGRLFREFAVTVGVAVLISGARLALDHAHDVQPDAEADSSAWPRVPAVREHVRLCCATFTAATLRWTMRHRGTMLIASVVFLVTDRLSLPRRCRKASSPGRTPA